jgi:hypothetical protein
MMLIEILRRDPLFADDALSGKSGEIIYDMSVGYDSRASAAIRSRSFSTACATPHLRFLNLKSQIASQYNSPATSTIKSKSPPPHALHVSRSVRPNEIEKICEFLIAERDLDVIVKIPAMLGKQRLEHLLHDVLDIAS